MQTFILLFIIKFGAVGAVSSSEQNKEVSAVSSSEPNEEVSAVSSLEQNKEVSVIAVSSSVPNKEVSGFSCGLTQRVVGGSETIIAKYPSTVVILDGGLDRYLVQKCGGAIINEKHVLTAAHCFRFGNTMNLTPDQYRVRVGSTCAHTGGIVKKIETIFIHPNWDNSTHDNDIAIIRLADSFNYSYTKQPAIFANSDYDLPDNESLWAIGWGYITERGPASEILRHVLVQSVNSSICQDRYGDFTITDNMMCSGWLNVGGRDQCSRDSGSPIHHKGTIVGLSSLGVGCGNPGYPAINVRISRFVDWMKSIAGNVRVTPPQKFRVVLRLLLNLPSLK